jgi:hypothetical protein
MVCGWSQRRDAQSGQGSNVQMLSESAEKQVKPFVADEVQILCESYMLSVITIKALVSNVSWILSIDVSDCHANVMNCFMMFWMNNVY